jgi:LuxR family transcriptional regulator, maltose regulon positive regulatory protein
VPGSDPAPAAPVGFQPAFALVEAKLHAPVPHPSTFSRARLTGLLRAEPRPPVVSVVAPPGYGKTVLLAHWAAQEAGDGRDVAWLTLGDYDNEPSILLTYVAAALDRLQPIDPSIATALAARGPRVLAVAVPRLASAIHSRQRPGLLVLDDVHRLVDRTCLDALAALVELLPPGFQVAMASRTPPDLPLARLRARQQVLEIGAEQLAFAGEETRLLAARAGFPLSSGQAQGLADRTEGWAAAIYLAALARGRRELPAAAPEDVAGRETFIADYLRSEFDPILDERDMALMTRTSILEEVEPALAEVVSGVRDAPDRLERLAQANLLVGRLALPSGSYRYHNLLREHLRAELDRREQGIAPELHGRAAAWYRTAGRTEQAVEHLLASGDMDAAAELVEAATLRTYQQGHGDRLERWLGSFSDGVFERRPCLAVGAALVHALNGHPDPAEHLADIVDRASFGGVPASGMASFASARALLRAAMVRSGPDEAMADAAFAVAAEGSASPWRTLAHATLALGHLLRGDAVAAESVMVDAVSDVRHGTRHTYFAFALLASLAMARHDWQAAARYASEAHEGFDLMRFDNVASSVLVHAVAARVAIHRGDQRRARDELVHAQLVRPLVSHALPSMGIIGLLEVARAYLSLADPAGAGGTVSEAEAILRRRPRLGVLGDEVADMRRRSRGSAQALAGPSTLTPAELRVLPLLSTHLRYKEIGDRLGVSQHTVKTQSNSIYGKLGVSGRSEAVSRAIEIGLLEPFPGLHLTAQPQPT